MPVNHGFAGIAARVQRPHGQADKFKLNSRAAPHGPNVRLLPT